MSTPKAKETGGIPAIMTGHTLQSLRDAGYSLPAAIAEVIDNSIEANANQIDVHLENADSAGKAHVDRIAIADDGTGMGTGPDGESILQHYLQLGYSTRYMSKTTIGKYGVGAKLAALNFAERIDVWSRSDDSGWRHVYFDLEEALAAEGRGEAIEIASPDDRPIPEELQDLKPEGTGTIVLWSKIDRLRTARGSADVNAARVDLEKELSRIFRNFISGGIELSVNETELKPHDPLFLMENTWANEAIAEHLKQAEGAEQKVPEHFPAVVIADEPLKIAGATAQLRVTLYPPQVTRKRGSGGDKFAKKLRVPDNLGAISFVRLDREINYTNVPRIFPRGVQDPDRFIGIEVQFSPDLDQYFGVRHVKRGVEPVDDLRSEIRKRLEKYLPEARKQLDERWGQEARKDQQTTGEHTPIEDAVKDANRTLPKGRVQETPDEEEHEHALEDLASDVGKTDPDDKGEYIDRVRELPFVVESVDFPGSLFIDIQHFSNQVVIRLNTRHRFYRELWEPIKEIAELDPGLVSGEQAVNTARRTIEALSLLIVAYGKAESMDGNPNEHFGDLRMFWGQFLDTLLGKVKDVV
jgi:Histidine kinase-, DNA gyrase B-, and HSP90-like ATPase